MVALGSKIRSIRTMLQGTQYASVTVTAVSNRNDVSMYMVAVEYTL